MTKESFPGYGQLPGNTIRAAIDRYDSLHGVRRPYMESFRVTFEVRGPQEILTLYERNIDPLPEEALVFPGTHMEGTIPLEHPIVARIRDKGIGSGKKFVRNDPNPTLDGTFFSVGEDGTELGFVRPELSADAEYQPRNPIGPPF